MNRPETTTKCSDIQESIELYLDGTLGETGRAALESHTMDCVVCAAELALARQVRAGLAALTVESCPPSVATAALAYAKAHPHPARRPWRSLMWRPALAGAVAVALLLITGYVGNNGKVSTPQYSRTELEQAREQAKWTLVFINQLSRKTAADLKQDVLQPEVSERLLRVIDPKSTTAPKEISHAI